MSALNAAALASAVTTARFAIFFATTAFFGAGAAVHQLDLAPFQIRLRFLTFGQRVGALQLAGLGVLRQHPVLDARHLRLVLVQRAGAAQLAPAAAACVLFQRFGAAHFHRAAVPQLRLASRVLGLRFLQHRAAP